MPRESGASGNQGDDMNKALFLAAVAIGLLTVSTATRDAPMPVQARAESAWTEFKWPFPVDQWGIGRAFTCKATACGVEVNVYLRPKIGFCKCATGVDDDDELERVGDHALIAENTAALAPSRVVEIAWMKGRSRPYRVSGAPRNRVLSIAFNDQCDVMVALATLGPGDPDVIEPAVLAFLNSERVLRWVKWLIM